MKKILFFLLIITSCYSPNITKVDKGNNKKDTAVIKGGEKNNNLKEDVPTDEFAYLFFNKSFFSKTSLKSENKIDRQPLYSSNDFKVIVDWQYEGGRKIKLKNIKNGKEYIIIDGDKSSEIVLEERALLYYKFRIGNTVIKVKK